MKNDTFLSKQKHTTPSRLAICTRVADCDHKAGAFLYGIQHWIRYASAVIPNVEGSWIANTRAWWMRECCLTSSQYDRTISRLAKMGLIERRQYWFGSKNVLYLRPTAKFLAYLASATTWEAADQFLPCHPEDFEEIVECENPSSLKLAVSKEGILSDEPGSPNSQISNTINNSNHNQNPILEFAAPASPPCDEEILLEAKKEEPSGITANNKPAHFGVDLLRLGESWKSVRVDRFPGEFEDFEELSPKELGALAIVENGFAQLVTTDPVFAFANDPEGYKICFFSFLVSIIDQWPNSKCFKKPKYPELTFLPEHWGDFIQGWSFPD